MPAAATMSAARADTTVIDMNSSTALRLIGASVLLFMLWLFGHYDLSNPLTVVALFGFAFAWERFVVKPAIKKDGGAIK